MNKQLKFKIKFDVDGGSLKRVQRNLESITRNAESFGNRFSKVEKAVGTTNVGLDKMKSKLKESNVIVSELARGFKRIASVYFGKMGLDALIETTDTLTSAQNKLNYINAQTLGAAGVTQQGGKEVYSDATFNQTAAGMEKIFNAAQQTRMSYTDMAENVGKSLTLAGSAFDNDMDKAIKFQKIMSEAYTVGGASAQQKASSMYQLIQALGSGRLQGDELRSVAEGAQMAYHQIETYAQALYGTTDSIKEMGAKGMLTADVVVDAIMSVEDEMDSAFNKTMMTFDQAKTKITNEAIRAFQPLMQKMTAWLNSDQGQKAIEIIINLLYKLANVLERVLDIIIRIFNYTIDHANTTRKVLGGIAGFLGLTMIPRLLTIMKIIGKLTGMTALLSKVGIKSGLGTRLVLVAKYAVSAGTALGRIIVSLGVIGGLLAGIVAVCWIFSDSTEDFLGRLFGWLTVIGTAIKDLGALVANVALGTFVGVKDMAVWAAGNVKTAFVNAINDVLRLVIGAGKKIAQGLNIFGAGIDISKFDKLQNKYARQAYTPGSSVDFSNVDKWATRFKVTDPDEAYKKGYKKGYNILGGGKDTSGVLDTSLGTLNDYVANALGGNDSVADDPTAKAIKDTADNTGEIAGQIASTTEDLTYLRKLAELEWKRDYTNYNIEIAMTNNNTITKEADVDQITHALNARLAEVAGSSASGLHF